MMQATDDAMPVGAEVDATPAAAASEPQLPDASMHNASAAQPTEQHEPAPDASTAITEDGDASEAGDEEPEADADGATNGTVKEVGDAGDAQGTSAAADAVLVVEERVEMDDAGVHALMRGHITAMLEDPNAGELSLAMVKERLRQELGKEAVKAHKDFVRDFVRQEVLRLQSLQQTTEQPQGEGEANGDEDDQEEPADGDEDYRPGRRAKPRRRLDAEEEGEDRRDAMDGDYEEEAPRKRRIPLKPGKKAKAAAGAAKRVGPVPPRSGYLLFSQATREGVKRQNPDASFGDVSKLIGEQWKDLDSDVKRRWREESERDKERYSAEMSKLLEDDPALYQEALREGRSKGKKGKKRRGSDDDEGGGGGGGGGGKKKKRRGSDSEGEEGDAAAKELSYFDSILEKLKNRRQTKSLYDEDDSKEMCRRFLHRMDLAERADAEAVEREQPAVHKLKMLDEVQAQVGKKEVADRLIDHGLLKVIKSWLQPLPDGSLQNVRVRSVLYRILDSLPITETDLETSGGLGKLTMQLYDAEDETADNRKLLASMMEKWMRPMLGLKSTYKHLADVERPRALDIQRRSASLQPKRLPAINTGRARIPEPANFDYAIRPASLVERDEEEEEERKERAKEDDSRKVKMMKRLDRMKKTALAAGGKAKYKVDVSGRTRGT